MRFFIFLFLFPLSFHAVSNEPSYSVVGIFNSQEKATSACLSASGVGCSSRNHNGMPTKYFYSMSIYGNYKKYAGCPTDQSCTYNMFGYSTDGSCPSGTVADPVSGLCGSPPPPPSKKAHFIPGPSTGQPFSPSVPGLPGSGTPPTSGNPNGFLPNSVVDDEGNVWDPDPASINCNISYGCTASYSPSATTVDPNDPSSYPPGTVKNGSTGNPNAIRPDGTIDYENDPFKCQPSCFVGDPDPTSPFIFDRDVWNDLDPNTNLPSTRNRTTTQEPDGGIKITDDTETSNPDGSKTKRSIVTHKNPDGSTTSTTTKTTIDAEGNVTESVITGSSSVQNPGLDEGRAVSDGGSCAMPPVCKGDAIDCAVLNQTWNTRCAISKEGDSTAYGDSLTGLGDGIGDAIGEYGDGVGDSLSEDLGEFSVDASSAQSVLSMFSAPGCSDLSYSFKGHDVTISCSKTSTLRELFGFVFGFMTVLYIFHLMVRPVGGV